MPYNHIDTIRDITDGLPPAPRMIAMKPSIDPARDGVLAGVCGHVAGKEPPWIERLKPPHGHLGDLVEVGAEHTGKVGDTAPMRAGGPNDEDVHD